MDSSLKKCRIDRLSSLPDELICRILSSLPTKDAAVASLSMKKMGTAFTYLRTLDFDDSPISYCASKNPQFTERFQNFKTFVDNVLRTSQSPYLSKFRLGFGGSVKIKSSHFVNYWSPDCGEHCYPHVEFAEVNTWIRFPLSRAGVREIDLRIHVRERGKLPSTLFTCETLEVLKLDTNLDFSLVSSMPSCRLPHLKALQLHSVIIPDDDFVSRIVSKCPLLQELCLDCWWEHGKSVTISSPSLRRLVLSVHKDYQSDDPCDLLNIDTPNLQYFDYVDILARHNFVPTIKALVEASIEVFWGSETAEGAFRSMLNLLRPLCTVQHLSLWFSSLKVLDNDEMKNQRPIFHNLKHLELDTNSGSKWDTVVFEFLMRSPVLEVLEFPKGIDPVYALLPDRAHYDRITAESERWFLRRNQVSPYCCKPHLKRITIKRYRGTKREIELVRFLLENAPVLEELLVICKCNDDDTITSREKVDPTLVECTLKKLPMASSTCLITVQ